MPYIANLYKHHKKKNLTVMTASLGFNRKLTIFLSLLSKISTGRQSLTKDKSFKDFSLATTTLSFLDKYLFPVAQRRTSQSVLDSSIEIHLGP